MRKINKSPIIILSVFLASNLFLYSQDKNLRDRIKDTFEELESNSLTIRFNDAISAKPIPDAEVTISTLGKFKTDYDGRAVFEIPKQDGIYGVKFIHPKYIASDFEIEITAGTLFFNRFSVSPKLPIGSLRVILDWSARPLDLDAHLVKKNDYHISYRNLSVSSDESARLDLDRDDSDGYGPETITANKIDSNAEYVFYVHDYSNRKVSKNKLLSESKATVKVYSTDQLIGVYQIPLNKEGNFWEVFKIINGQIIQVNEVRSGER